MGSPGDRSGFSALALAQETGPDAATVGAIADGLDAYNGMFAPEANWTPRWIVGRDAAGAVQAGMRYGSRL